MDVCQNFTNSSTVGHWKCVAVIVGATGGVVILLQCLLLTISCLLCLRRYFQRRRRGGRNVTNADQIQMNDKPTRADARPLRTSPDADRELDGGGYSTVNQQVKEDVMDNVPFALYDEVQLGPTEVTPKSGTSDHKPAATSHAVPAPGENKTANALYTEPEKSGELDKKSRDGLFYASMDPSTSVPQPISSPPEVVEYSEVMKPQEQPPPPIPAFTTESRMLTTADGAEVGVAGGTDAVHHGYVNVENRVSLEGDYDVVVI